MANSAAAELLIRIAADPSNAEASISRFRASFSRDLGGLSLDLARWTSQGTTQLNLAGRSAGSFGRQFSQAFTSADGVFRQNRDSAAAWRTELLAHLAAVGESSQALQSSLFRSFTGFDFALSRNVATALIWEKSIGQAFQRAAVTAIGALAQEAIVRAIFSTALGFYLLAIRDFTGAARAFESAAIFGTVGGAAALAGRALAGGTDGGSSASGREEGGSRSSRAERSRAASESGAAQPSIQIIFQGPVYGGQAGIDQLTREISRAVIERDVNLTAFTTVRQPATRA